MFQRNRKFVHSELAKVLGEGVLTRRKWFDDLKIGHRNLTAALQLLEDYFDRGVDTNLIFLIGMTGVGKTSLAQNALTEALVSMWAEESSPNDCPVLFLVVRPSDQSKFSWGDFYRDISMAGSGMPAESIRETLVKDGIVRFQSGRKLGLGALRDGVEKMALRRRLRALLLDEVHRFLRFERTSVMDTVKALADDHHLKILLIGCYDLLPMATLYAEATRRTEVVPFFCYQTGVASDKAEFRLVLERFMSNWPCTLIPNFIASIDELMEATMGGIGQLKGILSHFLRLQLRNPEEIWTPDMFGKSLKAEALAEPLRAENSEGETALRARFAVPNRFATKKGLGEIAAKLSS